ncbi:MAG: hypothetical protein JNN30_14990 [Rhodanobacteraceae bacterium]|nr:hypothetical protein [Rhodanobacteraceae bacterium]
MTDDTQIPKFDQDVLEVLSNLPDGQKLLGSESQQDRRHYAIVSASGGYDQNSGEFIGWFTYGLFERKIRFQTTRFTSRLLSFHGAAGFLSDSLPLERLAGQTGTFVMSGNKEISAMRLWLGNELICTPLILLGQGGMGHHAEGEVVFRVVG